MMILFLGGCATEEEKETQQNIQVQAEQQENTNENNWIDMFLAGELNADGNGMYVEASFSISELPMDEEEWDSYSIGERLDLDNDGTFCPRHHDIGV